MMVPEKNKIPIPPSLLKNSAWLFVAEVIAKLTALGVQILAARYLGTKGYGIFSFSFVAASIVLDFIDYGLRTYLTRELSTKPDLVNSLLANIFIVKWFVTLISLFVFFGIYSGLSLDLETLWVAVLVAAAMILNGYSEIYLGVFRAFERMQLVALLMVLQRIIFFVIGFWVLVVGGGIVWFSSIFLLASLVNFFLARKFLENQKGQFFSNIDSSQVKKILNESKGLCLAILFVWLYFRIDSVLIFLFLGKEETGLYFSAFKIIESLALVLASIRGALFPALSRVVFDRCEQLNQLWKKAARSLFIIAIPISVISVIMAPKFIELLYGSDFEISSQILQILAAPFIFLVFNEFITYILLAAKETRSVIKVAMFGTVFSLIANIVIIPKMGIVGVALVAGLTELLVLILFLRSIREICGVVSFLSLLWRPVLAAIVMILVLLKVHWSLIPLILFSLMIYFLLLVFLREFNADDILEIKNVISRKRYN